MTSYYDSPEGQIHQGHVLSILKAMPSQSVHMCVTSPPYWGLRDYKTPPQIWDAEEGCEHVWGDETISITSHEPSEHSTLDGGKGPRQKTTESSSQFCQHCNAWRGSLGLEPTPELFVQHIVQIFREVRKVLRDDGTLWLNLGDSYAGGGKAGKNPELLKNHMMFGKPKSEYDQSIMTPPNKVPIGMKPKDLVGIPWMVAFALRADGWYLRSDIIWHKPNPMPESVTDRPTKSHEYVFLLSKSQRYYYDADAIKEPLSCPSDAVRDRSRIGNKHETAVGGNLIKRKKMEIDMSSGRNKRSVWTIATHPFPEAHFATFPPKLIEPCILAGTSEKGCCPECGSQWVRVVEKTKSNQSNAAKAGTVIEGKGHPSSQVRENHDIRNGPCVESKTIGWEPSCACGKDPVPSTVMDIFGGAMTTAIVAYKHDRKFVMCELSKAYIDDIGIPRIERETSQLKLF